MSEQFILAPEKGAVGFVAASGTASLVNQGEYGLRFYRELGGNMFGNSAGHILRKLGADMESRIGSDFDNISYFTMLPYTNNWFYTATHPFVLPILPNPITPSCQNKPGSSLL